MLEESSTTSNSKTPIVPSNGSESPRIKSITPVTSSSTWAARRSLSSKSTKFNLVSSYSTVALIAFTLD